MPPTSRYLKATCPCGYTARVTRKHLRLGAPLCPVSDCDARPMDCADFEETWAAELDAWNAEAFKGTYREIRTKERQAARVHLCASCSIHINIGERYEERVYTVDGTLFHERYCGFCERGADRANSRRRGRDAHNLSISG